MSRRAQSWLTFALVLASSLVVPPPSLEGADAASNLKVPQGFKLELLYTVPRDRQGSWVNLCVDDKGRIIASDQGGRLYRLVPPPAGEPLRTEPERFELDIGGAHGLLHAFGSLYVMVNERDPRGLYRLRDTNGDDKYDEMKLLRQIRGGGEHGMHAILPSPDGKSLTIVCGNSTSLTKIDSSLAPLHWGEDSLVRRIPTGFMDDSLAPQGWIARTDPDGKEWQLVAMGFRNEFDAAYNREGELFTYDADMEWDIGAPWYRPTRVNHVTSGAEYGFRNGSGKWPESSFDSLGAVANVGPGSPTGICFGYGAKFPARYQNALFLCDWSFGKIRAVHLTPAGSSYTGEVEDFVSGQPLAVTDLVVHPGDGTLYFAVGGRGTQSALYRLSYVGSEPTTAAGGDPRLQDQRDLRRKLEAFHGKRDPGAVETVWEYLGSADRALRYAARIALEWQDPASWTPRALAERDPRRAIAALAALARVSARDVYHRKPQDQAPAPQLRDKMLAALGAINWDRLSGDDRSDLLRAYALVFIRLGSPEEPSAAALGQRFASLFPTRAPGLDVQLANLLVFLQHPDAASRVMEAFRHAPTQEEQIEYALALRALKVGWTPELRAEYFKWFSGPAAAYRGGNTFASSLRTIRNEAEQTLSEAERTALKPILEAQPVRRSPRDLLAARPIVKSWTVEELVPIVERGLAGGRDFERGRRLYTDVACSACHRFVSDGGSVGPELTGLAGRFSVRDVLEAIVTPSKVISDQYSAITIVRKDGSVVTGRVANLGGESFDLIEDMFDPGHTTGINRNDIETSQISAVSMMPEGLLNSLKEDEVQDLIAYLLSRGDSKGPAFKK